MRVLIATVGCPGCGWVAEDTHAIEPAPGRIETRYTGQTPERACPNCGRLLELDVLGAEER